MTHERIAEGADGPVITGMACACGWRVDGPQWSAFDAHLTALGICPRCRNRGRYAVESGNQRYMKRCACKHGRARVADHA